MFTPACCTSELQPLDLTVNLKFKTTHEKIAFTGEVNDVLDKGQSPGESKVDLRASVIKQLHANWLIMNISTLQKKTDCC